MTNQFRPLTPFELKILRRRFTFPGAFPKGLDYSINDTEQLANVGEKTDLTVRNTIVALDFVREIRVTKTTFNFDDDQGMRLSKYDFIFFNSYSILTKQNDG